MIAKKKMDDYNWPDLYRQADEFMRQYIPETMIHARYRLLFDGRPAVTVHFPEKGHKQELNLLQKKACFRRIRGTTVNGVRLIYGKRLNFRHGYKNPRPHFCNRSTLIIHI